MTDQPISAQPEGDGQCKYWDDAGCYCVCGTGCTCVPFHPSQPARDAAERADHGFRKNPYSTVDKCALCGQTSASHAPPQPAPDAVREALAALSMWVTTERQKYRVAGGMPAGGFDNMTPIEIALAKVEGEIDRRAKVLAGPVPPAEGVVKCGCGPACQDLGVRGGCRYTHPAFRPRTGSTGEHLTGNTLREYLRGSDALKADAEMRRLTEDDALERLVEISDRANAAAPSPAVAAAPAHSERKYGPPVWSKEVLDKVYGGEIATPPVSLDREAIARALFKNRSKFDDKHTEEWFRIYAADPAKLGDQRMSIWQAYSDADATLALHVQPGAGEPEAAELRRVIDRIWAALGISNLAQTYGREISEIVADQTVFLRQRGYRMCDNRACNCNSWHGGHAEDRLADIRRALESVDRSMNGVTLKDAVELLAKELADMRALALDMGTLIRRVDESGQHSELWTQDDGYIIDGRFQK